MIGTVREGGDTMKELDMSEVSSGSITGASGKDFCFDLGMVGYRAT